MAEFYSTQENPQIDYAYKPPIEMMLQAIAVADQGNDQMQHTLDVNTDYLGKIKALTPDEQLVQQTSLGYKNQIDSLASDIQSNPEDWRKKSGDIRNISRSIQNDKVLQNVQTNYGLYQKWDEAQQKLVQEGKVTPEAYQIAKNIQLHQYGARGGAYDKTTGLYNQLQMEGLNETPDLNKVAKEATDKMKATLIERGFVEQADGYFQNVKNSNERISPAQVALAAKDALMADPKVTSYLKQGSRLGYLPNQLDENGNLRQPFSLDEYNNITGWDTGLLANAIRSRALSQSFEKDSQVKTQGPVNAYKMSAVDHAEALELQNRNFAHEDATKDADLKRSMLLDDYKTKNDILKDENKAKLDAEKAGKGTGKNKTVDLPLVVATVTNVLPQGKTRGIDEQTIKTAQAKIPELIKRGQWGAVRDLEAEQWTAQQDVAGSMVAGYKGLLQLGYSPTDIKMYNEYLANPKKFGSRQDVTGTLNMSTGKIDPVEKGTYIGNNSIPVQFRKKMDDMTDALHDINKIYYKNLQAQRANDYVGVSLKSTQLAPVREGVYQYLKDNAEMVTLYDPKTAEVPKVRMSDIASRSDFKTSLDVQDAISRDGVAIKVQYDGKTYLAVPKGDTNIGDLLYQKLKTNTDPQVQQFVKQTTNTYMKSLMTKTNGILPGQSKKVSLQVPNTQNDQSAIPTFQINRNEDGTYDATIWNGQTWQPVNVPKRDAQGNPTKEGVPLKGTTRQGLADELTNLIYSQSR